MRGRTLDHVGIAVPSIDEAIPLWTALVGMPAIDREQVESQGVEVVFVGDGSGRIELIAPTRPDSPVARFLERRGPGIHHIAYRVPDIRRAIADHIGAGFVAIDAEPRQGAGGHLVAFLHPRSTGGALVELVEQREA
jgi:methylmalonyl-CoA/ethylmalonyl-CoA epimerase